MTSTPIDQLRDFGRQAYIYAGLTAADAELVVEIQLQADMRGVDPVMEAGRIKDRCRTALDGEVVFIHQQFPETGKTQYSQGIPACLFVNTYAKMQLSSH